MADMPRDLKEQIEKLEEIFVVPTKKLKEITDHFVKELEKGLSVEGGSIVSDSHEDILAAKLISTAHEPNMVYGFP
jgi:hexokinase